MSAPAHPPAPTPRPYNEFYDIVYDGQTGRRLICVRDGICPAREHYLERDVAALAQISHPNIELKPDTYHREGKLYAATQRTTALNLRSYLKKNPNAERVGIAVQIAGALVYLHTTTQKTFQVVHGNLHPTNVFMDGVKPVLSGFALFSVFPVGNGAKLADPVLDDGHLGYKAPELLEGGVRTSATDVYAFGMLLYEIFAGHEAFSGAIAPFAPQEVRDGVRCPREDLPRNDLGAAVWNIVKLCWAEDPTKRPDMPRVHTLLENLAGVQA
ncbi:kinase-like protein [Auricularia subglabra TFB-10046 SS5]|nr:kinase-like protein [Auricularia subglabra TFB-10046 SS5]